MTGLLSYLTLLYQLERVQVIFPKPIIQVEYEATSLKCTVKLRKKGFPQRSRWF